MIDEPQSSDDFGIKSRAEFFNEMAHWLVGDKDRPNAYSSGTRVIAALAVLRPGTINFQLLRDVTNAELSQAIAEFDRLLGQRIKELDAIRKEERLNAEMSKLYRSLGYEGRKN